MSKKKSIFIACEEAGHTCDKSQYKEASFWDKVKLNIHLIYCRACREYTKNNQKLTKLTNKEEVDCLTSNEKEVMKDCIKKELQNQN
ncbi:glycine dehydrogenase [Flavobacteriaceae sp. LMIT009]|jgi:hypothetical protein